MKNLSICLLVLGLAVLGCDNKPTTPAKPATPTTSHSPMGHAHAPAAAVDKKDDAPAVDKKDDAPAVDKKDDAPAVDKKPE